MKISVTSEMASVQTVLNLFAVMSEAEQRECMVKFGMACAEAGLLDVPDLPDQGSKPSAAGTGKSGGRKRKGKRPFWAKVVTGFDPSQRGAYSVEGDWVNDWSDLHVGQLVLVGSGLERRYWLLRPTGGAAKVHVELGRLEVEGLEFEVGNEAGYEEFDEIKRYLGQVIPMAA